MPEADQSLAGLRAALAEAVQADAPDIAARHHNLALALHELATTTADAAAAAEAVTHHRAAVAAAGPDSPWRVPLLCTLASGLRGLYGYTGNAELLHEAVQAASEALDLPGLEPSLAVQYAVLAGSLGDLYEHTADTAMLSDVIEASRDAASFAQLSDDPDQAAYWGSLGGWLRVQYERTGDVAALGEGIRAARKAVAASGGDRHLGHLSSLGDMLRMRFERTGDLDALTEAVAASRTAVAGTWPGHPDLARRATHLSGALNCRYDRTGDPAALAEAIIAARQAVAAAARGDDGRAGYLINLCNVLELDWDRTGNQDALAESVRVGREAVAAAPPGHHLRASTLHTLANAVDDLYERTGDRELLTEAVQLRRDALTAGPGDHPDRAMYLHGLGEALRTLGARTGDRALLDEAVRAVRAAIAATPDDAPDRALRLGALSSLLDDLAGWTGDGGPLTEAVAAARAAVAATAPDDPGRATLLDDLGTALTSLYRHTRSSAALREAVTVLQEALAATPEGHLSRTIRLTSLAYATRTLGIRTDDPMLVLEAALLIHEALGELPDDHPGRAVGLNSLAETDRILADRFPDQASGYLDDAIRHARESLAATPEDDRASLASRRHTLSRLLFQRGNRTGDPVPLAEALELARQAVAATPADEPDYPIFLDQLGVALFARQLAAGGPGGDPGAVAEAWQCCYAAARHPLTRPGLRIAAYRRAAELADGAGRTPQEALGCIEAAVDLLPSVLPSQADRADQEHEIGSVMHLAGHAAEVAVMAGRPDRAVELLERTRGVLAAGDLDGRAGHTHRLSLTAAELGGIAADGPIVYLYANVQRCDALILTAAGNVRLVPLAVTTYEVNDKSRRLLGIVGLQPDERTPDSADPAAQREVLGILDWLREGVTGPVLRALGYDRRPAGVPALPRIWWCPVGNLAFLPVHAACLDEVISSYALTARTLRNARRQPAPSASAVRQPLVVAVPDAPDAPPLRGADQEADVIADAFPGAFRLSHPTRNSVLAALPDHPVAHFACHGSADPDDPGHSRLLLHDHVTVADIGALRLAGGLAFLSACETAITTEKLANEAIHLTGAFQLAGYQHVVGTLWQVGDQISVRLVRDFYAALTEPGHPAVIDVSRTATALHHATRRLRDRYPQWPTFWAAHTHTGP
jgi:hypothetical protein